LVQALFYLTDNQAWSNLTYSFQPFRSLPTYMRNDMLIDTTSVRYLKVLTHSLPLQPTKLYSITAEKL